MFAQILLAQDITNKAKSGTLSKVVQLRTGHDALKRYFEKINVLERNHECGYGQSETIWAFIEKLSSL